MAEKNKTYTVDFYGLASTGAAVGRIDGMTVFCEGALPGERAEVLVIKTAKSYCVGKLIKLLTFSPDRAQPLCPRYSRCGGCSFQHLSYEKQIEYKRAEAEQTLRRISGRAVNVEYCVPAEAPYHYRNKAQLPVGTDKNGGVTVGYYGKRSHNIIAIDECPLQLSPLSPVIDRVKELISVTKTSVYDEVEHRGSLRHVAVRTAKNGDFMIILVVNRPLSAPDEWAKLINLPGCVSVQVNRNTAKGNVIFGNTCSVLAGADTLNDELAGVRFKLSPLSFLQVNHAQAEKLYALAAEFAEGAETVLDAYCGIGIMTQLLARTAKRVIGVEISPDAVADARACAAENGCTNAEFVLGDCSGELPGLIASVGADTLVVDPPRAGCDAGMLQSVEESDIKKIIYISCDTATLARDIALLPHYAVRRAVCVDIFCQTGHVENIILLERTENTQPPAEK